MVPPINLNLVERVTSIKKKRRKLFLLSEGTLTEPYFLQSVLTASPYLNEQDGIDFYITERSDNDFGVNTLTGMVSLAYLNIINKKDVRFRKNLDKVVIFFDLDIYRDSIEEVLNIIKTNREHFIFVFTNPAIELFLLLCKTNSYEQIIEPRIKEILKNEKDPITNRRYIHQLLIDSLGVDPKNRSTDFTVFSSGLETAIQQEKMFLSKKLVNLSNNLISNFGNVLEHIKNGDIDNIEYSII